MFPAATQEKANDPRSPEQRVTALLRDGQNVSVDKKRPRDLPEWFDEKLFARGKEYFHSNFYAVFVANLIGLILVLTIPTILDVLILTNKSSEPYTAFRRYLDTIRHMLRWYKYDLKKVDSKCQKSVTIVHGLHCAASRISDKSGLGLRVTQKDMVLTQFGFMGLILLKKKELAIEGTDEDEMAIVHFWRTIGYFIGIQDKYNLCQGTLEEVRSTCDIILKDVYVPALMDPPAEFHRMVVTLIEGIKPISPMLDVDAFMTFTRRICGLPDTGTPLANTYSRWMYNIQAYTHDVLLTRRWLAFVFRPLLNYNMMFSVWLNVKFPFGAACKFGMKTFSRVPDHAPHPIRPDDG
ncbi:Hypothetical protein CINCED_3A008711 [Cinara cedri]|uniref:ER-bound oxygenase mpaB/mpaB'/Rubber oxygenase catalytic domain-containing protein n=1 Tax=Cinara cedri TaxID=506608 RepID=A0A5E4MVR6_9HEMI|nr:Hypothetical protein CINCED_3A008711 [Cinara cedri]